MRTFYFDLVDGTRHIVDEEGHLLESEGDAREEALRVLAEIIFFEPTTGDRRELACSVRAADGTPVLRTSLLLEATWAGKASR